MAAKGLGSGIISFGSCWLDCEMNADSFCRTSLWYDYNTVSEHCIHAMILWNGDDGLKTQSIVYVIHRDRWSEVSMSLSGKIENFSILQIEVSSNLRYS